MHTPETSSTRTHRARWAAIGAAVAVSLGAGGLGIVKATSPEGASAYVPISPCRLLDTRADSPVGTPTGALGPDTEITLNAWGAHGNCTLPTATTGLELNVTAVDASTLTNLRVYPEGADTPTASNLNPAPGEPPTPNSVTATLNTTNGQFHVFNRFGTVHIVIDVVGYYTEHMHDGEDIIDESLTGADVTDASLTGADVTDESLTGADVLDETLTGADVDNSTLTDVDLLDEAGISRVESDGEDLTTTPVVVASVAIQPPTSGYVTVSATFDWFAPANQLNCQITDGTTTLGTGPRLRDTVATPNLAQSVSIQRTFDVEAYSGLIFAGQNFNLVCEKNIGTGGTDNISMTATFFSTEYEPFDFVFIPLSEPSSEGEE